ncbi:MAG: hypothetical protein NT136_01820 [Candidatus Moranbacteria bacterium]|nr:hypothetical protein [Candidatus Moranbacteria bacterium]
MLKSAKIMLAAVCLAFLCVAGAAFAETPMGYPWLTWGEGTQTIGNPDTERGFKLDAYFEQGIDWTRIGETDWIFNTFLGLRGTISDHKSDYWNNKVGPWAGIKLKHPLKVSENSWGDMAIGLRGEYYDYFGGSRRSVKNDIRVVGFLQWSLGGDWKKK